MKTKVIIIGAPENLVSATVNGIQALIDKGDVEIVDCTSIKDFIPEVIPIKAPPELPKLIGYEPISNDAKRLSQQGWKNRNKYKR